MTDDTRPGRPRRPRETIAERRAKRAEVEDPAVVLEAAARFLGVRARSVAEVRRRLAGAGYRLELVEGAIGRMMELGMLDDDAFARAWVESRDRARPRGERAIRDELRLKGVERQVVDVVLAARRDLAAERVTEGADGDPDGAAGSPDGAAAERLLAKNARALDRVTDPRRRRQRAYALLARHGFDPETCATMASKFMARTEGND